MEQPELGVHLPVAVADRGVGGEAVRAADAWLAAPLAQLIEPRVGAFGEHASTWHRTLLQAALAQPAPLGLRFPPLRRPARRSPLRRLPLRRLFPLTISI